MNKKQPYRFETTTIDFSNKNYFEQKSLIREVRFTYYGKRKELFVFKAFISKVMMFFNQKEQDDKLLREDVFAFGNLELGINGKGEIAKVYNLREAQHRWERRKLELRKDNSGYELDSFFNEISNILDDETKMLFFLNSKNMYGLYFHGLFGKNDINEAPKKRIATILEFDDVTVIEKIWTDKRVPRFIIRAEEDDGEFKSIISSNDVINRYEGELIYNKENQLQEGYLEIENENINIKHSVVWVG
ncbi:hypothetical protein [Flavobacterium sp. AJR]|uniref:hypothetical protein n=1 Tax=Flavobacterium sp. AJR TaxID=1979369 RepID=UPI000F4E6EA9|nr:hypothetical protein [Flavobacterium sp. AJR]